MARLRGSRAAPVFLAWAKGLSGTWILKGHNEKHAVIIGDDGVAGN